MTPYRYFKDKEDILAAVRARAFNRWAERARSRLRRRQDRAREVRRRLTRPMSRFAFGEPAAYRLMFDLSQPDESHYPELVAANIRARATMTDYVRELVDEGMLEGDPELIGHVFWASLHGADRAQARGQARRPDYDFDRISGESFCVPRYRPSSRRLLDDRKAAAT